MRLAPALLGLSALLSALPARAAEPPRVVAVFTIQASADSLTPTMLEGLSEYLATRIGSAPGFSIVPRDELRSTIARQKAESFKACYDQSCQIEIGKEVAASHVVSTKIAVVGSTCLMTANLFMLELAATEASAAVKKPCREEALIEGIDQLASELTAHASGEPEVATTGRIAVESEPGAAQITLDGRPTGKRTPAELTDVAPGAHALELETATHQGRTRASVTAGRTARVTVRLEPKAPPPPPPVAAAPPPPPTLVTEPAPPEADDGGVNAWWLSAAGALVAGGVVLDVVPSTAKNGQLDALDFVPVGMYALAAGAALLGILPAF